MTNTEISNAISAMAAKLLQESRDLQEMKDWAAEMYWLSYEADQSYEDYDFCECDGVSMGVGRYCSQCLPIDPSEIGYTDGK